MSSATAACLRKHAAASVRSRAQISPTISSSAAAPSRSWSSATGSANPGSADPPGATSRGCPAPNPPAGPPDQPGTRRADPGCPGPRRPRVLASAAASPARSPCRARSPVSAASVAASSPVSAQIAATSRSQGMAGCSGSSYSSSGPGGSSSSGPGPRPARGQGKRELNARATTVRMNDFDLDLVDFLEHTSELGSECQSCGQYSNKDTGVLTWRQADLAGHVLQVVPAHGTRPRLRRRLAVLLHVGGVKHVALNLQSQSPT